MILGYELHVYDHDDKYTYAAVSVKLKGTPMIHFQHIYIYCHMPVGWGLQQTTQAPGSDKTQGQGSFGPLTGRLNLTKAG